MDRDVLQTCPTERRARHQSKATKVVENGHRAPAIRLKCLECCAWDEGEVRRCALTACALWGLGGQSS